MVGQLSTDRVVRQRPTRTEFRPHLSGILSELSGFSVDLSNRGSTRRDPSQPVMNLSVPRRDLVTRQARRDPS